MEITKEHLKKRVLLKPEPSDGIFETIIEEISPSEEHVKFNKTWHSRHRYSVIEILNESKEKELLFG